MTIQHTLFCQEQAQIIPSITTDLRMNVLAASEARQHDVESDGVTYQYPTDDIWKYSVKVDPNAVKLSDTIADAPFLNRITVLPVEFQPREPSYTPTVAIPRRS